MRRAILLLMALALALLGIACTPNEVAATAAINGQKIADTAKTYVGYAYGPPYDSPPAFSCDGLVIWVFGQHGVTMPHLATQQGLSTPSISASEARAGDLVFFHQPTYDGYLYGHVGIVVAPGYMVAAANHISGVKYQPIYNPPGGYVHYGRVPGW